MKSHFFLLACICIPVIFFGQNVGIGTNTPNANALLDLTSETKGLLIPRVPLVAPNNAAPFSNPPQSLLVFNTSFNFDISPGFFYWRNNKWNRLTTADDAWTTTGNVGTNAQSNFIGTTDNASLYFRIRNVNSGIIDSNINRTTFGFGTARANGGIHNSAFGYKALGETSGQTIANTAIGSFSMQAARKGSGNAALGYGSLFSLDSGTQNTGIGSSAMSFLETGNANTAVGNSAMSSVTEGDSNTAVGFKTKVNSALQPIVRSTAIGSLATVGRSDAIVLGSVPGENTATRGVFVGIGTINPQRKLHIVDETPAGINSNANSSLVLEKNGTANYINFLNANAESGILFGVAGAPAGAANGGILYNNPSFRQGLNFRTGGNVNRMVIDSVGNVGIGTVAPQFRLTVSNNDAQNAGHRLGIMIENTAEGDGNTGEAAINLRNAGPAGTGINYWMVGLNQNRNLAFAYGNDFNQGATRTVIDSTGKMGLGVINPTERLDVNGNIRLNGKVTRGTGTTNMIPLCYGVSDGNGNLDASTGNFTIAKLGTGQYEVTIPGETYITANYITLVTPAFFTPAFATTFSNNGKLRIYIFDITGAPRDQFFHFVVYKP